MGINPADDASLPEEPLDSDEVSSALSEEAISSAAIDEAFGPAEPIEDELLTSVGDVPLVEAVEHKPAPEGSSSLTRALWFFGIVVTALIVLQTIQMFVVRPAVDRAEPSLASHPGTAGPRGGRSPAEEVDRALFDTRVSLKNGLYEQVLRILEPLAEDPQMLDANQRFEAYLLLAKAHRALGNVEKAQQWSLKATDQAIDRREPAQVFEEAATLADEGRHADARRVLHQLLARADALTEKDADYRLKAQVRVADAWWGEAIHTGAFAPLPGLDHRSEGDVAPPKPEKHAGAKR
jgi:tetratricopeptide (TPR) repeat protein